ncbi:hypothetical protein FNV43_RR26042 [Rhamnella rubrinervis]|uniref:EamA domain-containing protein n=1 Tax=Rhamnella rubrinervis TaxID=2594499 RepID=A0A8K0DM76_9ROSA|nr:hypothetical protein FNV43_RR26042 [Rhamnella rubrinervis]
MDNKLAFVGMVIAILAQASNMEINKVAMSTGTNKFIILVYSNGLSTLILLPSAFFFHRADRPRLTFSILCRLFSLALLGCSAQTMGYIGIEYSSATLGSALLNLIPAFTFILAIIFRMEIIELGRSSSQAKCMGTLVSIMGALVVTLYKGPPLILMKNIIINPTYYDQLHILLSSSSQSNRILGGLFLAAESFLSSLWYILQVSTQKKYPAVLMVVLYQCLFATLLSATFACITVKDASAWSLKPDMGLLAISYTAIIGSAVRYSLITWCVWRAGALYCSMFKPLAILFTVFIGAIFLGETLYLGSLIGAVIIVIGFYGVVWGKAKEEKLHDNGGESGIGGNCDSFAGRRGCGAKAVNLKKMGKVQVLPLVGMVMAECAQAGLIMISKVAMSDGMNSLVFVFYSNALASLVLLLSSSLFYRSERPQFTFAILAGCFLLGVLGFLAQFFGYAGINYSSPTLGTAMLNLVPAFTYVFAVILRMEKLDWRSSSTLAKSLGTIVSVSGAFIVTFYKGPTLLMAASSSDWVIGGLLLIADCIMTSAWLIVEVSVLRRYPAELIVVFYYCFFAAILSGVASLFVERDPSAWSLKPKIRLLAVLYSAVFGSAFQVGVATWCLKMTGPVFVAMFKPLGIVITVVVGTIFLGETFYLGRLIGAIVIVTGFYSVMWGKAKEAKLDEDARVRSLESNRQQAPLLQNCTEEN